jgi:group I intron endonuclease
MKSGIYKITNTQNGKFYIGSSKNIEGRWNDHKQYLRGNYHINPKLQHAWNFYGEDKFLFEILEEVNQELLFERENYYISSMKPYEREVGYNICPKAEGGDNFTHNPRKEEIRKVLSDLSAGKNNFMYGKTHDEKTIKLMKEKSIGRYTLDWFIEKYGQEKGNEKFQERNIMLKNRKINYVYDNKLTGTKRGPMSEEVKKRISERKAHLKLIRNDLHRDILSNNFTIPQLELKYGTSKPTILREKRKLVNR